MRLRTRVFLFSFVPFALLLACSFVAIQFLVQSTVRQSLKTRMRDDQTAIARLRDRSERESARFLRIAGENASLKAGMQLLRSNPDDPAARATVEDLLADFCGAMGFDLLIVSDTSGKPLAGVMHSNGTVAPLADPLPRIHGQDLHKIDWGLYQIFTAPIDQADENLGAIWLGKTFDLTQFSATSVLLQSGRVIRSDVPGVLNEAIEQALQTCGLQRECEAALNGIDYLLIAPEHASLGSEFQIRNLQNVDAAVAPLRTLLQHIFLVAGLSALCLTLVFSLVGSRAIAGPIMTITSHLRKSETTGQITEFAQSLSPIPEVREMISSFNRAAHAIRGAQQDLQRAYLEFVSSMANALDARDRYTAGHSRRVSSLSCSIATELGVESEAIEQIRLGALLHDIGKIGISDTVLQKPSRLTDEEFTLIKNHPEIGRRILGGVHGLSPYLAAIELHHENWNGSGYPHGQVGEETPLDARVIHVADAYDAMTSDRPYRRGMGHDQAMKILSSEAGRQFDPHIVAVFEKLSSRQSGGEARPELQDAA